MVRRTNDKTEIEPIVGYREVLDDVASIVGSSRRAAARAINATMTATYFLVGRSIVTHEQRGARRSGYGERLIEQLAEDLSARFGRGYSAANLRSMRLFFLNFRAPIPQTSSGKSSPASISQTLSGELSVEALAGRFVLPWSHYVLLLGARSAEARHFYETEAVRGGWTVRQLKRQIDSQFYERTALSKNKSAMLKRGESSIASDAVTAEEELKSPFVLEFLDLKDEYSENDLEEALIQRLEHFLLELGGDFTFVGRQRRLRIGDTWYRVDLLFFHRKLRCLVVIDLKLGPLTHADAGQMHMYLNYAHEHWTHASENPPVGLILCTKKNESVAKYALTGLPNKVLASEYRTTLPDEKLIAEEIAHARHVLEDRATTGRKKG